MTRHFVLFIFTLALIACTRHSSSTDSPDRDTAVVQHEKPNTPQKQASDSPTDNTKESLSSINIDGDTPLGAQCLIASYPEMGIRYDGNHIFVGQEKIVYDDRLKKTFVEHLDNCDIDDMFAIKYNKSTTVPEFLSDPGRCRSETFFKAMYGHTPNEVAKNLVSVAWFGQSLKFTKVNHANRQLEKVAKELEDNAELRKYFARSSTFYWRTVRGANRLSAHSYGIAIDINVAFSDYWLWANPSAAETDKIKYKNRIPIEIVNVFEKYGFIWGGRWYHFDTMHFEYRPELLLTTY